MKAEVEMHQLGWVPNRPNGCVWDKTVAVQLADQTVICISQLTCTVGIHNSLRIAMSLERKVLMKGIAVMLQSRKTVLMPVLILRRHNSAGCYTKDVYTCCHACSTYAYLVKVLQGLAFHDPSH